MRTTRSKKQLLMLLGSCLALVLAVVGIIADAARRRAASVQRINQSRMVVRLFGTADMVLSSSSRWLRHPSLSEPGAPFADGPAILDIDPAGAMIGPPLEVLAGGSRGVIEPNKSGRSR